MDEKILHTGGAQRKKNGGKKCQLIDKEIDK
jgi:hypothetical protein